MTLSSSSRRHFLKQAGGAVALGTLAPTLSAYAARRQQGVNRTPTSPYGDIAPVLDQTTGLPLLKLPQGFRYASYGWTGDIMSDGTLTPDRHDGMAVVATSRSLDGELVLIRNHERGASEPGNPLPFIGDGLAPTYDDFTQEGVISGIGGGTTTMTFRRGRLVDHRASLAGTLTNCAGGRTPWNSWLTCEEVTIRGTIIGAQDHGYVFEVPAPGLGMPASAVPIIDMGFMDHEAVAVDPATSFVYLTEDNGPNSGFYEFRPNDSSGQVGALEQGGELYMLKVVGQPLRDLRDVQAGDVFDIEWVRVEDPNADPEGFQPPEEDFPPIEGVGKSGPFLQGEAGGAAFFNRGEGCWYYRGLIYFVDTSGGAAEKGTVFAYEPVARRLSVLFVSPDALVADNPDNITVSPNGGVLVCEDGGGVSDENGELTVGTRMLGIEPNGNVYVFAENNMIIESPLADRPFIEPDDYRSREWAGATFGPLGNLLFVNIQTPGVTFAITGPWERGPL